MTYADYATLVQPDRVHSRLYKDPAIFEDEMDRIFSKTWEIGRAHF